MEWWEKVKEKRLLMGLSQAAVAKQVGASQSLINRIEHGQIKSTNLAKQLASVLEMPFADIEQLVEEELKTSVEGARERVYLSADGPLPIHHTDFNPEDGELTVYESVVGTVVRPNQISGTRFAISIYVNDDLMAPEFTFGDLLYLNPSIPLVPGCTALFSRLPFEEPKQTLLHNLKIRAKGVLRYVERVTSRSVQVRCWNPSERVQALTELDRDEWSYAGRVVLKEYRR